MAKARILVVDDEEDILMALRTFIEGAMKADVVTATSGAEGLKALDAGPIDLVVSDYRMPVMTGVEFLARVRARMPDVPRVLLTAYPDMELAIRALNEAAIAQFLTKPVQPDQLLEVIGRLLEQSRRQRLARQALEKAPGRLQPKE